MSDATSSPGPAAVSGRIVEAIVAEIALRRVLPHVFLLNESGRPTAWPTRTESGLPPSLQPLVDMYFAQDAAHRVALAELVDVAGVQTSVRIIPYHADGANLYALLMEPFVLRSRPLHESGELSAAQ